MSTSNAARLLKTWAPEKWTVVFVLSGFFYFLHEDHKNQKKGNHLTVGKDFLKKTWQTFLSLLKTGFGYLTAEKKKT